MLGGEVLARSLKNFGVEVAFGLHGGHLDGFLLGCRREGIELVDFRNEASAVHAADGYSRISGKLGVAFATAASGFSNAMAGLSNSFADRTPLLLVTSSPPLRDDETNPLQGSIDQVAWAGPVTKWAHRVTVGTEIPHLVSVAIRTALAGAPGPVVLDVPIDIIFQPIDDDRISWGGGAAVAHRPAPDPSAIDEVARLLEASERPVLIAGAGARGAGPELLSFVERHQVPVFNPSNNYGALPARHPLNGWGSSRLSALRERGQRPDLVLLMGVRPGVFLGGRSGSIIPHEARVVQVDTDASEIGKVIPFSVGITADVRLTLSALLAADILPRDRSEWVGIATGLHRIHSPFEDEPTEVGGRMHPYHAVKRVMQSLPEGTTILVDGGETCAWVARTLHFSSARRLIGNGGYLGMLGMTPGLAIGAQVAEPGRPVVVITGDGGAGFHLQEFDTMARLGLPIVSVIINNASWQQSADGQRELFGEEGLIISSLADTDYEVVAEGLGAEGRRVSATEDIADAVRAAFASGRPTCLNLSTSPQVIEPGTPAKVGQTDDPDVIVIPYYENVRVR